MEDNKVIEFAKRVSDEVHDAMADWIYEQRLYSPVTGESFTILSCPASEMENMVKYLMESDDVSDNVVAEIAEKFDPCVSPEFKKGN